MQVRIEATGLPGSGYGVVGIQSDREVVDPVPADATGAHWSFEVRTVEVDGSLDLRGAHVHGRRGHRFFYLSRCRAERDDWSMYRRAKLMLDGVGDELLKQAAQPRRVLVGRLSLTSSDGSPRCAAVRPPEITWTVESVAPG